MSPKEMLALRLLAEHPSGLYGSELVALTNGKLARASIYTILERLSDAGLLREMTDAPTETGLAPRTRHVITGAGQRALQTARCEDGLEHTRGEFGVA
jgi:DNA-binding PadR family transcriptional regulator